MSANTGLNIKLIHCGNLNIANAEDREPKNIFFMPMGIFSLADALGQNGFDVEIIHLDLEHGNPIEAILDFDSLDAVGLDLHWVNQAQVVLDTAALIKKTKPDVFIFLGGFSASLFAEEVVSQYPQIDAVIRGDGETPVVELCRALQQGKNHRLEQVQNLVWKDSMGTCTLNPFSYTGSGEEMEKTDFACIDRLRNWEAYRDFSRFWTTFTPIDQSPLFLLEVGRGCTHACTFCGGNCEAQARINNRKQTAVRSVESVVTTIKKAVKYGFETFYTCMEFEGSEQWYLDLFQRIREENLRVNFIYGSWKLPSRTLIDAISQSFPHALVEISPETASNDLRKQNKDPRLFYSSEELEQCLDTIDSKGNIKVQLYFGYYLLGDTGETVLETMDYIIELLIKYPNLLEVEYSNFSTDPGSLFFFHPERYGIEIKVRNFNDYLEEINKNYILNKGQPSDMTVFRPGAMSAEEDRATRRKSLLFNTLFSSYRGTLSLILRHTGAPAPIMNIIREAEPGFSGPTAFDPLQVKEILSHTCQQYNIPVEEIEETLQAECDETTKENREVKAAPQVRLVPTAGVEDTYNEADHRTGMEVAVIGMAGRFPGARTIDEFWENLKNGVESISFFTDEELEKEGVEPEHFKDPAYVKARGLLEDKEYFDAFFFGYIPAEAAVMDPQVRIFHQCTWEALEDAGYNPDTYEGLIGLYGGASSSFQWEALTLLSGADRALDPATVSQLKDRDFMVTRVSYKLNLRGPAVMVQTACSTSLVAIHMACRGLLGGEFDMALAGGVSILAARKTGYMYQDGMIASPDGHCRAFDASARGTNFGDGAGIVVLKPLEDALADRDHIYAVIKGSAINNDGVGKVGYSAPGVKGQLEAIRAAYHIAEVHPETVGYIETHGTGTALGDPTEIEALKLAFASDKKQFCRIGSVKTNIGHLDSAAGAAGLIKAVLTLKHQMIPESLFFKQPNPEIDFENSPFFVNAELYSWRRDGYPLRAGVSSFGIGGTNAHVVLEEWPGSRVIEPLQDRPQLMLLSARTQAALDRMTENLAAHLKKNPGTNLADAAYTLQTGRKTFEYKKMFVCSTINEAVETLGPRGAEKVRVSIGKEGKKPVVFMFPGQGSQYMNMGRELYETEPVFAEELDRCLEILKSHMDCDIKEILYPPAGPLEKINQTEITQPVIFSFEVALAKLLMHWGIQPWAMIGHSIGEYVAAYLAGVFSLEDALKIVVLRGKLMQQMPGGSMLSLSLPEEQVKPLLTNDVSLAAVNTPSACVLSGPDDALESFNGRRLHTSHAYHSPMMKPAAAEFKKKAAEITFNEPQIPFISNVTGTWIKAAEAVNPGYWADHLLKTVRFSDGLSQLLSEGDPLFVEVGPGKSLSTFVRKHKQGSQTPKAVNLVRHPKEEVPDAVYLLNRLGELWLYGAVVDWNAYYGEEKRQRVSLPVYSFDRHYYWIEGNPFKMGAAVIQQDQVPAGIEPVPAGNSRGTPRPRLSTVYAPPADETEEMIAGIFREFFGFEKVGVFDDFFEMGGDSLKITAVAAHIHKALNVRLTVSDIFKAPTVRGIAQFIREAEKNVHTAIPQAETRPHYPLSSAQKRLYLFQEMDKESTGYNIYTVVLLEGELQKEKLEGIFQQLIRRHESLRTSFKTVDGEPVQVIHENAPFAVDYFSAAEEKTREMVEVFVRPFNLGEAPLVRAGLIKIEDRLLQHILVLDMHHIITDGTSMGVFVTEFMALYNGEELPPLQLQYKDYAEWQKGGTGQEALKKQEAFWLKEFAGQLPVLNLPIDYDRPEIKTMVGNVLDFSFDKGVSAALKNLALEKEATLYMVLLTVFNIFLAKIADAEDIIVGIGSGGRNHTDLGPIIGMFFNTLAIRNYPAGEKTVEEFLAEIKERTLKAFDNQDYQFEDLVQKVAVKRDHSRSPLFDVMFGLQNLSLPTVEIPGLTLKPYAFENKISRYDLAILGAEIEDHLAFTIEYSTRLFREETIRKFIGYFETVAAAVSEDPGRKIKDIEIIAEEEKQALLSGIEKDEEAINIDFDF